MSTDSYVPQYYPNASIWKKFDSQNLRPDDTQLPKHWPSEIRSPMAWTASDLESNYISDLSKIELEELAMSCHRYSGLSDFPDEIGGDAR